MSFLSNNIPSAVKVQATIWLLMIATLSAVLVFLQLYVTNSSASSPISTNFSESNIESTQYIQINKTIENLDGLNDSIAPIEFEAIVRDMRNYPKEFKDKIYVNKRKGKWTVQVMTVSNHEVIKDYLSNREDRDKFAYFRYTDQDNEPKYMLIYGQENSLTKTMTVIQDVDFSLPESIEVIPEEMTRYATMIDNYERNEAVLDMSKNRPRSVKLQKTKRLIPASHPKKAPSPDKKLSTSDTPHKWDDKIRTEKAKKVDVEEKAPKVVKNNKPVVEKKPKDKETTTNNKTPEVVEKEVKEIKVDPKPSTSEAVASSEAVKPSAKTPEPKPSSDKPVPAPSTESD